MRRLIFLLPVAVFLALAAVIADFMLSGRDPRLLPSTLIDKPAPQFSLPAIEGFTKQAPGLSTKDLAGKVTVINFFASWCVPCRVEHPVLMRIAAQNLVPLYGVNYKNKTKDATDWLEELGNPYERIGQDITGRAGIEWGVYGLPETYIIDKEGRIRYRHVGPLFPEVFKETIMPLIEKLRR